MLSGSANLRILFGIPYYYTFTYDTMMSISEFCQSMDDPGLQLPAWGVNLSLSILSPTAPSPTAYIQRINRS